MFKLFRNTNVLLFLILGLATVLRLWSINTVPVSLFGDELDLGYHAYSILKTGKDYMGNPWPLHFHSIAEWRTPLYLYSAVPTVALFGISPFGVRLPAVIFGVVGVFGIYLLVKELLSYKQAAVKSHPRALLAALLMAISPWHIQYSRAGFEVTELLAFLIFGLYFFFRALRLNGRGLWMSVILLCFTPWIYSTAKLYTPLLFIFLFFVWRREIFTFPLRRLVRAVIVALVIGLPIAFSTLYGGGTERLSYISIFTDPTVVPEIGTSRLNDLTVRGEAVLGSTPTLVDRYFHNKFIVWGNVILRNYFNTFSLSFLFNHGDPNLRHSIHGMGQFFAVEVFALLIGLYFFVVGNIDRRIKALILFMLIAGTLPSSITRDGGNHATRLILILPPLILLISVGLVGTWRMLSGRWKIVFLAVYSGLLLVNVFSYVHNYYVHYPWDSERWWHYGFRESISAIKEVDRDYDKVIISMSGEPAWIFFAAWYEYPPTLWQKNFPIGRDVDVKGFGKVSHIDKFYFGKFGGAGESLYDLGKYIDNKTLYLAPASEFPPNLILEPERTPPDLKLLKAVAYPSGVAAYYLFTKI
jgi:4-amino-4-deoxy-L-arabinose transferase-like glycosyltransferase